MQHLICFVLFLLLNCLTIFSQQTDLSTKRYWESTSHLNAKTIKSTFGGGYVVTGDTYNNGFIFFNDSSGIDHWEKLWNNTISFETIVQLSDSGFIAGGKMYNPITNQLGGALMRLDQNGNEIWTKSISDSSDAEIVVSDLSIESDSSFFLVAKKTGNFEGNFVMKMGTSGTILWQKSFEANGTDKVELYAVKQASDKSLFISAKLTSNDNSFGLLIRLDSLGNEIWVKKNSYPNSRFTDLILDSDQLFCRNTNSLGEVILSSFDYNGTSLWNIKVEENEIDFSPLELSRRKLTFDADSNLVLFYSNFSTGAFNRFYRTGNYIDAISSFGKSQAIDFYPNGSCLIMMSGPAIGIKSSLITNNHFAVTRLQNFNSIPNSCFEGYLSQITNISDSLTNFNLIQSSICTTSTATVDNISTNITIDNNCVEVLGDINEIAINDFEIIPNPTNEKIQISINSTGELPSKGYLVDALGNEVLNFKLNYSKETIDASKVHSGIYWLKIVDKSKKVIIL